MDWKGYQKIMQSIKLTCSSLYTNMCDEILCQKLFPVKVLASWSRYMYNAEVHSPSANVELEAWDYRSLSRSAPRRVSRHELLTGSFLGPLNLLPRVSRLWLSNISTALVWSVNRSRWLKCECVQLKRADAESWKNSMEKMEKIKSAPCSN